MQSPFILSATCVSLSAYKECCPINKWGWALAHFIPYVAASIGLAKSGKRSVQFGRQPSGTCSGVSLLLKTLKEKVTQVVKCRKWNAKSAEDAFSTNGSIHYCKVCKTSVSNGRRCHGLQYTSAQKHKAGVERKKLKSTRALKNMFTSTLQCNQFLKDLWNAMLSTDIPLWKLQHRSIQALLEKYTEHSIPKEPTLRKGYVKECCEDALTIIRAQV